MSDVHGWGIRDNQGFIQDYVHCFLEKGKVEKMKIIGISGRARSGKDTAAQYLIKKNPAIIRRALADSLKEDAVKMDFATMEECMSKADPKVRRFLQLWGTEHGRCIDSDYWLLRWSQWVLSAYIRNPKLEGIVIPDIRFPNEAEAVLNTFGGYLLHIDADKRIADEIQPHASESHFQEIEKMAQFSACGRVVLNNGPEGFFEVALSGIFIGWGLG